MPNAAATKFLKQLIAAFCKFPVPDETKMLYNDKLSQWRLTGEQWDKALDILVRSREEEGLPTLKEIYRCLEAARYESQKYDQRAWAWQYFTSDGYTYAIRLISVNGKWVYPPGHRYSGQTPVLPPDATNIVIKPDNPALPDHLPEQTGLRDEYERVSAGGADTVSR